MTLMPPAYQAAIPAIRPPPDGHEERIDIGSLFSKLRSDSALAKHGLVLIESMHGHRTRFLNPCLARSQRIRVPISCDNKIGTVFADARDFGWGRDRRN
jgi:hypothetical protein